MILIIYFIKVFHLLIVERGPDWAQSRPRRCSSSPFEAPQTPLGRNGWSWRQGTNGARTASWPGPRCWSRRPSTRGSSHLYGIKWGIGSHILMLDNAQGQNVEGTSVLTLRFKILLILMDPLLVQAYYFLRHKLLPNQYHFRTYALSRSIQDYPKFSAKFSFS